MTTPTEDAGPPDYFRRLTGAVGRAIVSTIIIGLVALGVFVLRQGYFHFFEIQMIAAQNVGLFAGIFCALVIWHYWNPRSRK